jgi:hypothetical protein
MATMISYEKAWAELDRMKAECGAELPDGLDSLRATAQALLNSADPPRGKDEAFCLRVLSGNVIVG